MRARGVGRGAGLVQNQSWGLCGVPGPRHLVSLALWTQAPQWPEGLCPNRGVWSRSTVVPSLGGLPVSSQDAEPRLCPSPPNSGRTRGGGSQVQETGIGGATV